jgi:hypothetical protein
MPVCMCVACREMGQLSPGSIAATILLSCYILSYSFLVFTHVAWAWRHKTNFQVGAPVPHDNRMSVEHRQRKACEWAVGNLPMKSLQRGGFTPPTAST